jgi:predicted membrane protein
MQQKSTDETLFWGLLLILIGILFLLNNTGALSIHDIFSHYWPVLIILVGLLILIKSRRTWDHVPIAPDESSKKDELNQSATFGEIFINLKNHSFQTGRVRTVFGGIHVDATLLDLATGEHTLHLDTVFGDIKFNSPKDLPIKINANNIAGTIKIFDQKRDGLNNHVTHESENFKRARKKLLLNCSTSFGDIKIW